MDPIAIAAILITTAACLSRHGDAYLCLFERLEAELEACRTKESALDRARRLAKNRRK